ncbi:MAG: type II toxin-antitoxin system VapC family toxin [Candidatus Cloacimonetes bacterium]|nr:type II toxin-antitoxin system VapC family toxin [Candidatus Cloacimonadota bacterium]
MKAVFDTNILIDYLNGFAQAEKELSLYEEKLISVITRIEVMTGARNKEEEQILHKFLSSFTVIGLDNSIANRTIELRRKFHLKIPDAVIYATAREQGCIVVSRNTRDFKTDWPDVRVPYKL